MTSKNIIRPALVAVALLLIPLVAMQFISEVNWTLSDFVVMGVLIFIIGLIFEWAMKKAVTTKSRIIWATLIILGFLYIWAELAVGIFTNLGS